MQPNLAVAQSGENTLEAELHFKLAQPSEVGEYERVITPAEGSEEEPPGAPEPGSTRPPPPLLPPSACRL